MNKLADLIEEEADELAALETLDNGKPIRDAQGRRPAAGDRLPPLLRRLGRQDPRPDDSRPRQLLLLHAARAGRRRRADHSLELPDADGGLEVGPGPGRRLHDRDEAGRADAADLPADGASWRRRPAFPTASSTSSPATARPPAPRSSSTRASTRSPSPASSETAQIIMRDAAADAEAAHVRAGRQEPEHRLRRRRPRRRRRRARTSASTSTRASAAVPAAGCSSRRRSTTSSSSELAAMNQEPQGRRSVRSGDRARPAGRPGPVRQDHAATSTWARRKGPSCVTGGKRHRRPGLLHRADALRRREGRHGDRPGRDLRPGACRC